MTRTPVRTAAATILLAAAAAHALVAGGGPAATDCLAVWDGMTATKGATAVACRDGDPACDADGQQDGACTFGVDVCVLSADVGGCSATDVTSLTVSRVLAQTGKLVTQALTPPVTPASEAACGSAAIVRLPLRGKSHSRPSKRLALRMRAKGTAGGQTARDSDRLTLQCLPNEGQGECPPNPAGGPRELRLVAADAGTDLDNGWTGVAHNFPIVGGSTLRACLSGCDPSTTSTCTVSSETGRGTINPAFGPPLPLFVLGAATCLVNEYDGSITGTADLATGAVDLTLALGSAVWFAPPGVVCPQCSGNARGDTGVCTAGPDKGRACRVEGTVLVSDANQVFKLSSSCRPDGTFLARLQIPLHVTTSSRALEGALPCAGQLASNGCPGAGTCGAPCTGDACVSQVPDPVDPATARCLDRKGGLSQTCCAATTSLPCFPSDRIERTGKATTPVPPWPDAAYPKTAEPVLVDVFCEPATQQNLLDTVTTGLPGASALILPVHACYHDTESCP